MSPKLHGILDYGLVASLLILLAALGFSKKVRRMYAAKAAALLVYVALTDHPAAVLPIIPFRIHGKIDPFNVLNFATHTALRRFRKDKHAQLFNAVFTALAGGIVALTDWDASTEPAWQTRGVHVVDRDDSEGSRRRLANKVRAAAARSVDAVLEKTGLD